MREPAPQWLNLGTVVILNASLSCFLHASGLYSLHWPIQQWGFCGFMAGTWWSALDGHLQDPTVQAATTSLSSSIPIHQLVVNVFLSTNHCSVFFFSIQQFDWLKDFDGEKMVVGRAKNPRPGKPFSRLRRTENWGTNACGKLQPCHIFKVKGANSRNLKPFCVSVIPIANRKAVKRHGTSGSQFHSECFKLSIRFFPTTRMSETKARIIFLDSDFLKHIFVAARNTRSKRGRTSSSSIGPVIPWPRSRLFFWVSFEGSCFGHLTWPIQRKNPKESTNSWCNPFFFFFFRNWSPGLPCTFHHSHAPRGRTPEVLLRAAWSKILGLAKARGRKVRLMGT